MQSYLLLPNERAPQHTDPLTDHRDIQLMFLRKPIHNLLQRRIAPKREPIPKRPLRIHILLLLRRDRLREAKERQREVDEPVLVVLELVLAVDDLVQLETDEADDERRRRGDRGDDLARDLLRRVTVGGVDAVVHRAEVGGGGDEVDMVVGVVVLLEVDRVQAVPGEGRRRWELVREIDGVVTVFRSMCEQMPPSQRKKDREIRTSATVVHGLCVVDLHLDATPGCELGDEDRVGDLLEHGWVRLTTEAVVEGMKVGSGDDV